MVECKPPDPEKISDLLVEFGRALYSAGKAYGIFAETINAVAAERPLIRRQLTGAWDLAFCWLSDEPFQHHPAMPITVLAAMVSCALTWGWAYEAAVLLIGWTGLMRIGEVLAARRSELVLPEDSAPGTTFALVIVKQPKTRGRRAKHQAARIDQSDVIRFLSAMYGKCDQDFPIWPYSASTLRKRFSQLLQVLKLPTEKSPEMRRFDLGSLRPGGATWLLHKTEQPELVRRRGRWLSCRVMEIYLQEVLVATYVEKLSPMSRELIQFCAGGYSILLERCIGFLKAGIPLKSWFFLLRAAGDPSSTEKAGKCGDFSDPTADNNWPWHHPTFEQDSKKEGSASCQQEQDFDGAGAQASHHSHFVFPAAALCGDFSDPTADNNWPWDHPTFEQDSKKEGSASYIYIYIYIYILYIYINIIHTHIHILLIQIQIYYTLHVSFL